MTNTELARHARVVRRHFDMGCAYMIGDAGKTEMLAMYARLEDAQRVRPTATINHELARFESFYVIAEYRREREAGAENMMMQSPHGDTLCAISQRRADSRNYMEWECMDSIYRAACDTLLGGMMRHFVVDIRYQNEAGNPSGWRVEVETLDFESAYEIGVAMTRKARKVMKIDGGDVSEITKN